MTRTHIIEDKEAFYAFLRETPLFQAVAKKMAGEEIHVESLKEELPKKEMSQEDKDFAQAMRDMV